MPSRAVVQTSSLPFEEAMEPLKATSLLLQRVTVVALSTKKGAVAGMSMTLPLRMLRMGPSCERDLRSDGEIIS